MQIFGVENKTNHRYDVVRVKTNFYRQDLDKTEDKFDAKNAEISYKNYLQEMIDNPVAAKAALIENLNKNPLKHVYYFYTFKEQLEKIPSIRNLIKKIENIEAKQSRTTLIRETLIANNRVKLDYVTPKLSGLKKILLKSKLI